MAVSSDVMVLASRNGKELGEVTFELVGIARELATGLGGQVQVALLGGTDLASQLGGADVVVTMDHPSLEDYLPDPYEQALLAILAEHSPRLLLLPNDTVGLDLGASVAVAWQADLAAYVTALSAEDAAVVATSQILGGKVMAEVELAGPRSVATVVGGAFPAAAGRGSATPRIETATPPAQLDSPRMSMVRLVEPAEGDVDITAAELLVSVGRGIGSADNVELLQELADALAVPLSASRPVIDAGWLPKTRQVGKSGLKVKPKVYFAFGISGAPEHLEGMRNADFIIACNTDAKAPIFDVAHVGTTADLFDLVPALVDKVAG